MEREGGWVSPQHSLGCRRLKPSAAGSQGKYVCLPWGSEVEDGCWIQGTHPSFAQNAMWWVIPFMGWEAEAGLLLVPLVHLDLLAVLQETAAHTQS